MSFAYLLLLLRGIASAFGQTNDKRLLSKLKLDKTFIALFRYFTPVVLLALPVLLMQEYQAFTNLRFIGYTFANVLGLVFDLAVWYYLLKKFDVSYIAVFTTLEPVIFSIISYFMLGEVLGAYAAFGIVLIFVGCFILEKSRLKKGEKFNFKNCDLPLIFVYIIVGGVITVFSKQAVLESSPIMYVWFRYFLLFIIFGIFYKVKYSKKNIAKNKAKLVEKKYIIPASLSGLFLLINALCEMTALEILPIGIVEAAQKFDIVILLILEYFFITKKINKMRIVSVLLVLAGLFLFIL